MSKHLIKYLQLDDSKFEITLFDDDTNQLIKVITNA